MAASQDINPQREIRGDLGEQGCLPCSAISEYISPVAWSAVIKLIMSVPEHAKFPICIHTVQTYVDIHTHIHA